MYVCINVCVRFPRAAAGGLQLCPLTCSVGGLFSVPMGRSFGPSLLMFRHGYARSLAQGPRCTACNSDGDGVGRLLLVESQESK